MIIDILKILFTFICCQVLSSVIYTLGWFSEFPYGFFVFISSLLYYSLTAFLCIKWKYIELKKQLFSINSVFFMLAGFICWICIVIILDYLTSVFPIKNNLIQQFITISQSPWGILSVTLIAAVFEEIIFRGAVMNILMKKISPALSVVISAAVFGLIHLNPLQIVGAFVFGLFLGWCYYKTKSLLPGIIYHFTNNTFSVIMLRKYKGENDSLSELILNENFLILVVAAVFLFGVSFFILNKYTRAQQIETREEADNINPLNNFE